MTPKIIHLCWFSGDPYPVEIKRCLDSWKRVVPDYQVKLWTADDARAIGCPFIDQALERRKWAFAADVVRFYAVWRYGGVYMDSDIYLFKRFDKFVPEHGLATFIEYTRGVADLQAAFFIGEKGNRFCRDMVDCYMNRDFVLPDGSLQTEVSPKVMAKVAANYGFEHIDRQQLLYPRTEHGKPNPNSLLMVYPGKYLIPTNSSPRTPQAVGIHTIYGSWRKRKLGRRIELKLRHLFIALRYYLTGR